MDRAQPENGPQTKEQPSRHRRADLKAYLDGEISALHRWWVSRHLEQCAACREELTVLERLSKEMQYLERAVPRPQLRDRILASLPESTPGELAMERARANAMPVSRGVWSIRRPVLALSGAGAVLLLMGAVFTFSRSHPTITAPNAIAALRPPQSQRPAETPYQVPPPDTALNPLTNTMEQEKYTDPTSLEAERLAAVSITTKLREKRQAAAADKRLVNPDVQSPRNGTKGSAIIPKSQPAQIALAVVDMNTARQQIRTWAAAVGATVTVVTLKQPGDSIHNTETSSASGPAMDDTPGHSALLPRTTLLQLRVPVQHADSLQSTLSQMGTRLAFITKANVKSKGDASVTSPPMMRAPIRTDETALSIPVRVPQNPDNATVVIYLRLQSVPERR